MNDNAFLKSRRTGIFKDMSNGTICIPKDLRDNNGLEKNDRVELIPMQEGIYIRKAYGEKKCQIKQPPTKCLTNRVVSTQDVKLISCRYN